MMTNQRSPLLIAMIALLAAAAPLAAQGKSGEKGKGNERGKPAKVQQAKSQKENRGKPDKPQARGKESRAYGGKAVGNAKVDRGNAKADRGNRFGRSVAVRDVKPDLRRFATSNRAPERIAAGALSRGHARGLGDDDIRIRQTGSRVAIVNGAGILLIDLDEQRARDLGNWRVRPYYDDVRPNAPAFCRSGEGHPVWGREWCLDKGFGLGEYRDLRWGRTTDVGDVIFRQVDRGTLARAVLIDVLGDVVFNRLGLHALTLGYSDPLSGVWLGEPTGAQVLRITAGDYPIAEFYDGNRDNRADALVVALRPWY